MVVVETPWTGKQCETGRMFFKRAQGVWRVPSWGPVPCVCALESLQRPRPLGGSVPHPTSPFCLTQSTA